MAQCNILAVGTCIFNGFCVSRARWTFCILSIYLFLPIYLGLTLQDNQDVSVGREHTCQHTPHCGETARRAGRDRYLMPYLLEGINTQSKKLFRQFTCLLYVKFPRNIRTCFKFLFLIQMSQKHISKKAAKPSVKLETLLEFLNM